MLNPKSVMQTENFPMEAKIEVPPIKISNERNRVFEITKKDKQSIGDNDHYRQCLADSSVRKNAYVSVTMARLLRLFDGSHLGRYRKERPAD